MGYKLGFEGIAYRNTGTYGSPVWDEIKNIDDLDLDIETDEAETSNRATGGFETIMPGLHKVTVEFGQNYDPADTDYTVIRDAQLNRTLLEFAIADAAIATVGTQYLRAHMYVLKGGRSEKLKEAMKVPRRLKPGYSTNANPAWVTVAS